MRYARGSSHLPAERRIVAKELTLSSWTWILNVPGWWDTSYPAWKCHGGG